ncbi:Pao retrotransposon peptidase [Oesophagostomum dentatum]|uniref:Pao retrotransposon peptidase n=1 Tax=Oesophagostomum dentatum TaxID=61180 RepID=A0A0B1S4A3_OESDE|nr:Pao retrotransposon peptidase [Oesophagostomum dentatum]
MVIMGFLDKHRKRHIFNRNQFFFPEKLRKRDVVSQLNSVYDPVGLIAPLLIKLKTIMREIFTKNIDWRDTVPDELRNKWYAARKEINNAAVTVPRCLTAKQLIPNNTSLVVFADASKVDIAVCAYLSCNQYNEVTQLISGKTRLAPKKTTNYSQTGVGCYCVSATTSEYCKKICRESIPDS